MCREITVTGLREFLAELRVKVPVSRLAKWKTTVQLIALGILIVGDYGPDGFHIRLLGKIGIWVAAVLTIYTGWDYLQSGLRYMAGDPTTAAKPQEESGIGRASGRERVCQYGETTEVTGTLKKKKTRRRE